MTFHESLSDSKSPQDSRTLLSIPKNLSETVFWMAPCCPMIFKFSIIIIIIIFFESNTLLKSASLAKSLSLILLQIYENKNISVF